MNISRLKHYIKLYMPYKKVLEYEEKRDFISQYFEWKTTNPKVQFDTKSKFESIISVEGFGYTGSGAVVDLLREYDDCMVQGRIEPESGNQNVVQDFGEVQLLQYPGGLVDIDSIMGVYARRLGDYALKRFASMAYRDTIFNMGYPYRDYYMHFFDSLIADVFRDVNGSTAAIMPRLKDNLFTIREYTKEEYYVLCQQFLYSIFNQQYTGKQNKLVLDQLMNSTDLGVEYCRNYLPNIKNIVIYRDPRDVYVILKNLNIQWAAHETAEHFIQDMKRRLARLDINNANSLVLRFEDLIYDYDAIVTKIEQYLELGEHKRPQKCLDISISRKNIGIWKTVDNLLHSDFEKIYDAFPNYCY